MAAAAEAREVDATVEWIFGFGSLVYNPGFEHSEYVRPCYIRGWRRVFHQGSTDHRGVPEAPGRTVTLEPCEDAVTWGAAYRLAGEAKQRRRTWAYLEWREKQYDLRIKIPVYTVGSGTQPHLVALTYVATADRTANPNYLGPAPLDDVARQIATACGPSGPNYEYLFRLADAMRQMEVQDEDLFMLEAKVRAIMSLQADAGSSAAAGSNGATEQQPEASSGPAISSA